MDKLIQVLQSEDKTDNSLASAKKTEEEVAKILQGAQQTLREIRHESNK